MIRQTLSVVLVWSLMASVGVLWMAATGPTGSLQAQQVVQGAAASVSVTSQLEELETTPEMGPCIEPNGLA